MALGTAHMTSTSGTHDLFVPETWSKEAQIAVENNLVARRLVKDFSALAKDRGGDVINIPIVSNFTPTSRSVTTASQVTPLSTTEGDVNLLIDTRYVVPFVIDYALQTQAGKLYALAELYKDRAVYGLSKQIDTNIMANYSSWSNAAQGTLGSAPTDDDILEGVRLLDTADAPQTERSMIVGSKTKKDLMAINKYLDQDFVGDRPTVTGILGQRYGINYYHSNNVPTSTSNEVNLLFHKEALCVAVQQDIMLKEQDRPDYTGMLYVASALWGNLAYRATFGVAVYGR